MNDLINRQAAIDAINHICPVDTEYDCTLLDRVDVRCVLSDLPSAQPEKRTEERTKTHTCVCIIKQQAIDAVCRWGCSNEMNGKLMITMAEAKQGIVDLLDDLPSVTPQPKMGHWRHYEGMLICSECGAEFYDDIMEYCGDDVPKRCPDCGAKMESEKK